MRKKVSRLMLISSFSLVALSCNRTNDSIEGNKNESIAEFKNIRILVNDQDSKEVNLVSPFDGSIKKFQADVSKANLYTSDSKRYGIFSSSTDNSVRFFDSGISIHDDHTHILNDPKWAGLKGIFNKPSHISTKLGEILVFNDGLGMFSYAFESQINDPAGQYTAVNIKDNTPHHGTMAKFNNGLYAVTKDDNSLPNANASLPERVTLVDRAGNVKFASTVATTGIHGDECDGNIAVFGSYNGALVVKKTGEQYLIPNPSSFSATDILGTIYYSSKSNKFFGRSTKKGIYEIDVVNKIIKPVLENANIYETSFDFSETELVSLLYDGSVKIYNTRTNQLSKEGTLISAFKATDSYKPSLRATGRFLYITQPSSGELIRVKKDNFNNKTNYKVSSKPYKITIIGAELNS